MIPTVPILELLFKVAGLSITVLGICAWIAGSSYLDGYWAQLANAGPLSHPSLQDTALKGFILPYIAWLKVVVYLVITSVVMLIIGIRWKTRAKTAQHKKASVLSWLPLSHARDFRLIAFLFFLIALYLFCLIYYLGQWINNAQEIGRQAFSAQACSRQQAKAPPTTLTLDNNQTLSGWVLDRSDKFLMLADGYRVYTIAIGDKVKLIDTTTLSLDCKKPAA